MNYSLNKPKFEKINLENLNSKINLEINVIREADDVVNNKHSLDK